MSKEDEMKAQLQRIAPNGTPDRDAAQKALTDDFVAALLLRGGDEVATVVERFANQYAGILSWLGDRREDEILRAAMQETGIDLTPWLEESN